MYKKLKNRAWRVLKSENILRLGPWLSVRQECVELPSGTQIPTWLEQEQVLEMLKDGEIIQALHAAPLWKYFYLHSTHKFMA